MVCRCLGVWGSSSAANETLHLPCCQYLAGRTAVQMTAPWTNVEGAVPYLYGAATFYIRTAVRLFPLGCKEVQKTIKELLLGALVCLRMLKIRASGSSRLSLLCNLMGSHEMK